MSEDRISDSEEREKKMKAVVDALWNFDPEVKLDATTPVPLEKGLALVRIKEEDHYIFTGSSSPCMEQNVIKAYQADKVYRDAEAERKSKMVAAFGRAALPIAPILLGMMAVVLRILGVW